MQPQSLVVPTIDYKILTLSGYTFTPFIPNPNTVCTVHSITKECLIVEECAPKHPQHPVAFDPGYWREILSPDELKIEELQDELEGVPI